MLISATLRFRTPTTLKSLSTHVPSSPALPIFTVPQLCHMLMAVFRTYACTPEVVSGVVLTDLVNLKHGWWLGRKPHVPECPRLPSRPGQQQSEVSFPP